ncbi:N-acetylmuramate 1-kinase [Candidatus Xenohaliotis californiensis]|uniref:N-acetylmuramate 1-kinase n=1 Tax=Candidatus Xenohaliotis californiensis TaxID=84677 RepID=A0ABP0EST8_9RICK|nr:N-acetylmuramate 1-kinase [Candidatus Xenohaliotis californiensis]
MQEDLEIFLSQYRLECFKRTKIEGDASLKEFERIETPNKNIILCKLPIQHDIESKIKKITSITKFLSELCLKPPEIYATDIKNGYILMEDFGNSSYLEYLNQNKNIELSVYKNAVDVLLKIHNNINDNDMPVKTKYTKKTMLLEVNKFIDYYAPCFKKITLIEKNLFHEIWDRILNSLFSMPCKQVLVLRDYHSPNIFHLPKMHGLKKTGIIDFDDALNGMPTYDVVSLLQDARYDMSMYHANALKDYYIKKSNWINNDDIRIFNKSYHTIGLQRSCKILGFIMYMKHCKKNNNYMKLIPLAKKYIYINISKLEKMHEIKNWLLKTGVMEWM